MGNAPSKTHHHHHPSSHPPASSKSRHQHPQYNPDNESSAQLGAASSEHLYALGLAKWDTGTSDETPTYHSKEPSEGSKKKKKKKKKKTVVKEVYSIRETVDTARASIEAVRGSPAIRSGMLKEENVDEPWGTVNEWYWGRELAGMGSWMDDEGKK